MELRMGSGKVYEVIKNLLEGLDDDAQSLMLTHIYKSISDFIIDQNIMDVENVTPIEFNSTMVVIDSLLYYQKKHRDSIQNQLSKKVGDVSFESDDKSVDFLKVRYPNLEIPVCDEHGIEMDFSQFHFESGLIFFKCRKCENRKSVKRPN